MKLHRAAAFSSPCQSPILPPVLQSPLNTSHYCTSSSSCTSNSSSHRTNSSSRSSSHPGVLPLDSLGSRKNALQSGARSHHLALINRRQRGITSPLRAVPGAMPMPGSDDSEKVQGPGQGPGAPAAAAAEGFPHRWKVVLMMAVSSSG